MSDSHGFGGSAIDNKQSGLRLLLAEDETLVRQAIAALLEPDVGEIVQASDGDAALNYLKTEKFDIALIDIGLPIRTGLDILAEVRKRDIAVKVIILTGNTDVYSPQYVLEQGADAFLYKTVDAETFLETILAVINDLPIERNEDAENVEFESMAQLREKLTSRELQIVKLVAEGMQNRAISENLFISEHTVRKHREHINRKLDIKSPTALAAFAIKTGLV